MAKKQIAQVSVEIDTEHIRDVIERRIAEKVQEQFDDVFDAAIRKRVAELVDDITRKQVEKSVTEALDEGWQATNSYGEPVGQKIGIKGRLGEMLTKNVGDYNNRMTHADKLTKEVIDATFRAEFGKEIKAAQERFRQALDAEVAGRFTATIKAALGLR